MQFQVSLHQFHSETNVVEVPWPCCQEAALCPRQGIRVLPQGRSRCGVALSQGVEPDNRLNEAALLRLSGDLWASCHLSDQPLPIDMLTLRR